MLNRASRLAVCSMFIAALGVTFATDADAKKRKNDAAIERLQAENPDARISVNSGTETVTFVSLKKKKGGKKGKNTQAKSNEALAFVGRHAEAFGQRVPYADVKLRQAEQDRLGQTHLTYTQDYGGVPVFGARLKAHFDENDELAAVTGTLVPDIDVSISPTRTAEEAGDTALNFLAATNGRADMTIRNTRLLIFRAGLAKGDPGTNHLAYEVEVGNGVDIREFMYIDAHTGKYIDQITGITDGLHRQAWDGMNGDFGTVVGIWFGPPTWAEGDAFPTASVEANNMILASKETYDIFWNGFGMDSYDGAGHVMDSIYNRGYGCPNASWNGFFISFCPGLTTDDITGHEWAHAYTDGTDNLIYQWQPGALNESYSDVIGETVDILNGRDDLVAPNGRTDGSCTIYDGAPPPLFTVNSGAAAGVYFARASVNEPAAPFSVGPLPMVHADPADGCAAFVNAADVAGKIAIIDWEDNGQPAQCGSFTRATNALVAGAAGILFVGPQSGMLNLGSRPEIGSVQVAYADGEAIKASLPADATMEFNVGTDDSYRWLLGEDSTAPGLVGALRDMWNPNCMGDPGKVSDAVYWCGTGDNGGVHFNSGVPNHAFSLLVDGGNFNGQSIDSIGLTKANHILFHAKTNYQGPATDFNGHADALEQSCADLMGADLASLVDGAPSGEVISAADCEQVTKAIAATELRMEPTQCSFQPLLAQNPPPLCPAGSKKPKKVFKDNFEKKGKGSKGSKKGSKGKGEWTVSRSGTTPDFTERDWILVDSLPDDREGRAYFGADPVIGTCGPGGDESSVLHLDSPIFKVKKAKGSKGSKGSKGPKPRELRMAFDHWHATELGWDGGNVKISVNGGPWTLIDYTDFVYNSYNVFLFSAAQGNTNPIAGEQAFSGADGGSVDGSWGRSIINLDGYALPGDEVQLRFDIGVDGCNGAFGWYVDDVNVYQCEAK